MSSNIDDERAWRTLWKKLDRLASRHRFAEFAHLFNNHPLPVLEGMSVDDLFVTAIGEGNIRIARACLAVGANVNRSFDGFPPISYALDRADDDLTMLRFLLEHGADPNVRMFNDFTPLHVAAMDDKVLAAKELLAAGAEVDARTRIDNYETPAMLASSKGHIGMLQLLLEAGADPAYTTPFGQSLLEVAAKRSHNRIADIVTRWTQRRI